MIAPAAGKVRRPGRWHSCGSNGKLSDHHVLVGLRFRGVGMVSDQVFGRPLLLFPACALAATSARRPLRWWCFRGCLLCGRFGVLFLASTAPAGAAFFLGGQQEQGRRSAC